MLRVVLYLNNSFPDLFANCIRVFHAVCKVPNFRSLAFEHHSFTESSFSAYIVHIIEHFANSQAANDELINTCSSISAFCEAFPERAHEFGSIIPQLINIVKEKTDLVRKNAAVCLAKLVKDEKNQQIMHDNHGTEVLVSLANILVK